MASKNLTFISADDLPHTVTPGERVAFKDGDRELFRTPKKLLDQFASDPSHHPSFVLTDQTYRFVRGELVCSCGYRQSTSLTGSGNFGVGTSDLSRWKAHLEPALAAPIHVWTATSSRSTYECYISRGIKQANALGWNIEHSGRAIPVYAQRYETMYLVSVLGSKARDWRDMAFTLEEAYLSARNRADAHVSRNHEITWHETKPVAAVSTRVLDLFTSLHEDASLADLQRGLGVIDEYLSYVDIMRAKRNELASRINDLMTLGDE